MKRALSLAALLLAAGCAHYTPLPLPTAPPLAQALPAMPSAPLTVEQVAALAVERNPDLIAARARRGVAQAQLVQAGVLPNPSLAGAFLPLISGAGAVPAWNVGITQDIKALIVYKPKVRAARDSARQVDADLLWQEWQTAGQARQLAVDLILEQRNIAELRRAYDLLSHRKDVAEKALAQHDITLMTASPSLTAYQSARANLQAADEHRLELRHKLNALLALAPDAIVPLVDRIDIPPLDPAAIRSGIATLPDRRPDLLALRLGYAAADKNLRVAILSQFPDLVLGGQAQSDSSKVINIGPQATIGLPVFDRNQGNVAIARATRAQLNAEYAARLASITGEVGALLAEWEKLSAQLETVKADLPQAKSAADRAAAAFGRSALDERSYIDLITTYFAKEQEIMTLETALREREVAIDTLIGAGLPTVATLPSMPEKRR
ncbi:MAG TPA: TolC family protein [Sphingomonas sp.]|nr:TolC family protein [Sphingomonas sp.]